MTTKKDRILALHQEGKTVRQIAEVVYGLPKGANHKERDRKMAYIRVVLNQRKGGSESDADRRYMDNGGREVRNLRKQERYATDPVFRAKADAASLAWFKARYHSDAAFRAKQNAKARDYAYDRYHTDPAFRRAKIKASIAYQRRRRRALAESEHRA